MKKMLGWNHWLGHGFRGKVELIERSMNRKLHLLAEATIHSSNPKRRMRGEPLAWPFSMFHCSVYSLAANRDVKDRGERYVCNILINM